MIRLYQNILGAFLFLFVSDFFPQHIASFFLPIRAKTPSHHCCNYLTHNCGYSSDCCNYFVICYLGCSATCTDLFVLSISALVIYHTSFLDTRLLVFALFNMQWDLDGDPLKNCWNYSQVRTWIWKEVVWQLILHWKYFKDQGLNRVSTGLVIALWFWLCLLVV